MVIIDADIIIEVLRKTPFAKSFIINEVGDQNVIQSCITVAETLVAATALHYNLPLLTINQKHFKHIPNLVLLKHNIIPLHGKTFLT